ncbi:MAG: LbtU family siderophore porin [Desulfosarcinaceae bacterium]
MTFVEKVGGVKSLEERVKELEESIKRTEPTGRWYDRIRISGLIEVEAGYGKTDVKDSDEEDEETSDIDLSNVELYVDAKITENVEGHLNIKYGDDDIFLDEGFIMLTGPERFPAYLIAGRQYVPFGNYDTFFITDPNTLVLGETNEGAAVAGYRIGEELVDISVGVFNGRAQTEGDDDTINSFVAAVTAQPLEGLNLGVSYTSNLAASNSFNDEVVDSDNLDSLVGAWSAFVTYEFLERFTLIGEYVGAIDNFKAGEIYAADDGNERKPAAWNVELGAVLIDDLSVALRYGGSDDGGDDFLPEAQYGAVLNWGFIKNTNLAVEYLHGEFEDDYQDTDTVTAQLAVEF